MPHQFAEIIPQFEFEGRLLHLNRHDVGHINETYIAQFGRPDGAVRRYVLQWINHHVFKDPERLMQNVERVTAHLRKKIASNGGDPERETLSLVPTLDGKIFYRTSEGNYWRAYLFVEGARTYQTIESLAHVYSAARAFGKFQEQLSDFPADQLYETIPNFHHTPRRFEAFVEAVERDIANRAQGVRAEIAFVETRAADTSLLVDRLEQGALPSRVTHNDTKFNNVMIDEATGEGICVIDLDTVMPGLALYDFGDAVRYGANTAAEDEPDLSKVWLDMEIFEHFTRGYLDAARDFLTPLEVEYLPFAAKLMTLECGMRFLTDYLNGDVYFRIHRPGHNLDRCRTQFKLVADMERRMEEMARLVEKYR